jgi:hypothetical protein
VIALKSIKLILDLVVHIIFLKLFIFIVKLKIDSIKNLDDMGRIKCTVRWIATLFALSFLSSIGAFLMAIFLLIYSDVKNISSSDYTTALLIEYFFSTIFLPFKDFLIATSLAYLYYF